MNDAIKYFIDSNLFYTVKQKTSPKFYTKFGITVIESGTKKLKFSEKLSGVGVDLKLEIYRIDGCECGTGSPDFNPANWSTDFST